MRVLIVAEKPSIIRAVAPFARRRWAGDHLAFINAVPYGNFKFDYPRGLKWSQYPIISEPRHKLADWASWTCPPVIYGMTDTPAPALMTPQLLTEADLIVFACDPDHTGAVSFDILLHQVFGDDRAKHCPAIKLYALDDASIARAVANLQPFGEIFADVLAYGHVKRYFDWNWNVNALAILGESARQAGVSREAPPISKYALQLLYALHGQEPIRENKVYDLMQHWPGTGRYSYAPGEWRPRLGSCASVTTILENLLAAKLLESENKFIRVSALGSALLVALHPDCADLDLPFRLNTWCMQGLPSEKPAIDRYLRTFFGKQKRRCDDMTRNSAVY